MEKRGELEGLTHALVACALREARRAGDWTRVDALLARLEALPSLEREIRAYARERVRGWVTLCAETVELWKAFIPYYHRQQHELHVDAFKLIDRWAASLPERPRKLIQYALNNTWLYDLEDHPEQTILLALLECEGWDVVLTTLYATDNKRLEPWFDALFDTAKGILQVDLFEMLRS